MAAKILFFQVLVAVLVALLFRSMPDDKRTAGLLAGSLFIAVGAGIPWFLWREKVFWRSLVSYLALAHLFFSALPMVGYRLVHFEKDFSQILIFGMPGPVFHYYAQKLYVAMMIAALIDLVVAIVRRKKTQKKPA